MIVNKYRYVIWFEDDGADAYWVAKVAELPGCSGIGDTREAAIAELDEIIAAAAEQSAELGIPMPAAAPLPRRMIHRSARSALNKVST